MTNPAFTHLHVHSHYTLLGGTATVQSLVQQAAEDGLRQLALTDTHALYGAVAFARACMQAGVQPVIGMAAHMAPLVSNADPESDGHSQAHDAHDDRIVLLATGPAGYRALCRLSSALQANLARSEVAQPLLGWEELKEQRAGLLCIAGGRRSRIQRLLQAGEQSAATRYLAQLAGIFDDQTYLALEVYTPADNTVARAVAELGARFGIRTVAVQPIYCLAENDRGALRLLTAMRHNCRLHELDLPPDSPKLPPGLLREPCQDGVALHWPTPATMVERYADFPDALTASAEIAAGCEMCLPDGRPIWPRLELAPGATHESALAEQAQAGLHRRYGMEAAGPANPTDTANPADSVGAQDSAIHARLQSELELINQRGFAPYFLLVADVVAFARRQDIPVSTRGSVANSLVAYCLQITTVDPVAHSLLFERFLNPARAGLPDIDLDFCSRRRDEVLHYVRHKYGEDRVALLATVSTLQPKSALREVAKVHGADDKTLARLSKRLPDRWHPDPQRRIAGSLESMFEGLTAPLERRIVTDAYAVMGHPHHLSIHPGGLVVTPGPLTDYFPVQATPKGFLISQFAHEDMETLGLPKMDLLGIRALTLMADAAALVRTHADPGFRLEAIPDGDAATGALLAEGATVGVFQCDSSGARRTLRQLQARTIQDLAVANAFFKPGPATGGMAASFIRRYRGQEAAEFLHPALAPILAHTQGVLLFQEQILRVATEIAGLSWEEADSLRRGMSKFESQAMNAMAARFQAGCQRARPTGPAFSADQARRLWEQVAAFAGYGFNQGHATAYADVSYRSAYLKAHWPAEFFAARLANYGGFHHPAIYIAEAVQMGIRVAPPHINYSNAPFTLRYATESGTETGKKTGNARVPTLWMGLEQVRSLRRRAVAAILAGRRQRPFAGLADLLARVPLQHKEIRYLIQCGALDGLGDSRAALLAQSEALPLPRVQAATQAAVGPQLAFDFGDESPATPTVVAATTPPESHPEFSPETPSETAAQRLAWEMHVLGFPVSVHPLQAVAKAGGGAPGRFAEGRFAEESLAAAAAQPGIRCRVALYRLPGWTGGAGWFVSDGAHYAIAIAPKQLPPLKSWKPAQAEGRWRHDEWGMGWLQIEAIHPLA
ncbi:MAG: DNA polymerase III subunit alpha [Litorilinea sp.]